MAKFVITGGKKLQGEVTVSGNKNSIFPLFSASLLTNEKTTFTNVPQIKDVEVVVEILRDLGCSVLEGEKGELTIDPAGLSSFEINSDLGSKLRGAIVLASGLLVRFGKVDFPRPGGDPIGVRPIEAHMEALSSLGAKCDPDFQGVSIRAENLAPGDIFLEEASPTATEMAMIVAASLEGKTSIEGAAAEPHVEELAQFLVNMGVEIKGAGTNKIEIRGKKVLRKANHRVSPDFLEAGTFAVATAITGGEVIIHDALEKDLKMTMAYLSKMGVDFEFSDDKTLHIRRSVLKARQTKFQTRPWPGFPTDMMSQFIVLATQTEGTVLCHDWMYESRMYFVDRLIKMGANITLADPHRVIVVGPTKLHGDLIPTADIRAGGALVLAGLVAEGETVVEHAEVIDRGYESFEKKLVSLGAEIKRVE